MATNDQYLPEQTPFGMSPGIASTGAPGSAGATEAGTMADNAFRAPVTMPYQSVQNTTPPTVGVGLDDTGALGQDQEGISGLGPNFIASTGAGLGPANHSPHPAQGAGGA